MTVDESSLGPLGPNILSIEPVGQTEYSVEGHNFAAGFRVEVRDGVGQTVEGVSLSGVTATAFTLALPYSTPGPYTVVVINPDGRTSTALFETPGTTVSNRGLRVSS